jgi:hypothetical protein
MTTIPANVRISRPPSDNLSRNGRAQSAWNQGHIGIRAIAGAARRIARAGVTSLPARRAEIREPRYLTVT